MNDERVVEEIVTEFIFSTCRLRPQLSRYAAEAAVYCAILATQPQLYDVEADITLQTTGSVAEFYTEPMLPHIGDVDVMFHRCNDLAIPQGHPPPTQLPAVFHSYVQAHEIIDSHLPGYVYLELRYLLTECVDYGKHNAVEYDRGNYLLNTCYNGDVSRPYNPIIHGPALHIEWLKPLDAVLCIPCLSWPTQAADWPIRHRNYGWPDAATVERVVIDGCDVVPVAHRQCRQHELMGKNQWRLSFSRAEILLLNSWMPVQQIVYHTLRHFMKTERLTEIVDNSEAGKLSNYHIKTLMLWACELKPRIWWTDHVSLVRISVELLHDLAVWLTEARCPQYVINSCNLVDSSFNLEIIQSRLVSISESWMSSWFVNSYIRKCSQLCPHDVSRLFDDISSTRKLKDAVSAVVDWRLNSTLCDMWYVCIYIDCNITFAVSEYSLNVRSLVCWLTELRKISKSFSVYFLSVAFLHVACRISRSGLNDELMDLLAIVVGQPVGSRHYFGRHSSVLLLSKAVNLMKAVDDRHKSRSTVQLIKIELSKAYLQRALSCKDSDSDSIYCLANVYLAVLYYTIGQYQTAIDHCTLVMRSQDHSQCSSHVVQGELLPKTDDDIDTVLGLAVFYQHVRMSALNQQHQQHVTVFTPELFAHYLHMKCLSVTKCQQLSVTTDSQSSTDEVQSYLKRISHVQQLLVGDVLLGKLISAFGRQKSVYRRQTSRRRYPSEYRCELDRSDLTKLLQESAAESLTRSRQLEAQDFGSEATIVTTDFEALYAYKRGDSQRCLQLSTQNVRTLMYADCMFKLSTFPEFIQLLDDDIVSLTALTLIVNPKCRKFDSAWVCISQLTLSLYLMTQCQLKLRHSVMSLAQTLECVKVAHRRLRVAWTLERLTLKMIAHKALTYIRTMNNA